MNDQNKKKLREAINEAALELDGKLPDSLSHPGGRNPHAHVAQVLMSILGHSYTRCTDRDVSTLLNMIEAIKENPF